MSYSQDDDAYPASVIEVTEALRARSGIELGESALVHALLETPLFASMADDDWSADGDQVSEAEMCEAFHAFLLQPGAAAAILSSPTWIMRGAFKKWPHASFEQLDRAYRTAREMIAVDAITMAQEVANLMRVDLDLKLVEPKGK